MLISIAPRPTCRHESFLCRYFPLFGRGFLIFFGLRLIFFGSRDSTSCEAATAASACLRAIAARHFEGWTLRRARNCRFSASLNVASYARRARASYRQATSATTARTIQDWYTRYGIAKAEGVAEVASVGGFVKQYSVVIDPRRLQALGIPLAKIREALRTSNMDVGGRTVELAETEFAVRGRGLHQEPFGPGADRRQE